MERDHLHEGDLGMKVKIIYPGGMLDEHNKRNPGAAVELGDLVVSVNGVRGNWDEMLAEFAKESVVVEVERPLQRSERRNGGESLSSPEQQSIGKESTLCA